MPRYRYFHMDVFTDRCFSGNQLAVVPDAGGIDAAAMQRIAAEFAFPETIFVFPPAVEGVEFTARIFTPGRELPMAGHPTIGATFALAHLGRLRPARDRFMLGLGIGPTRVRLDWNGTALRSAWMRQNAPQFGRPLAAAGLAAALGLRDSDLAASRLPVQEGSAGVPFLYVPLVSRDAVDSAVLDRAAFARWTASAAAPALPLFVFSVEPEGSDCTVFSRMFAPHFGIAEDPATGGASGPLGAYLVTHGAVPRDRADRMISLQGQKMGRPSRIHIAVHFDRGKISEVEIGGGAALFAEGNFEV